jgi:hypothetical protein
MLYNRLAKLFAHYLEASVESIIVGSDFDLAVLSEELQEALVEHLEQAYITNANTVALEIDAPPMPIDELGTAAGAWARLHATDIEKELDKTTQKVLREAAQAYLDTPGMTRGELEAKLKPAFGEARAESIATTEITRANAAAVNELKDHYEERYALQYERIWQTNADEMVCDICRPLNGKPESEWGDKYPDGAPAHPRCRCAIVLRLVKDLGGKDDKNRD